MVWHVDLSLAQTRPPPGLFTVPWSTSWLCESEFWYRAQEERRLPPWAACISHVWRHLHLDRASWFDLVFLVRLRLLGSIGQRFSL